jgi:hypothetical protein
VSAHASTPNDAATPTSTLSKHNNEISNAIGEAANQDKWQCQALLTDCASAGILELVMLRPTKVPFILAM